MEVDGASTSANPGTSKKKPKVAKKPSAGAMQIDSDQAETDAQPMEIDPAPAEAEAEPIEVDEQQLGRSHPGRCRSWII